MGRFEIVLGRLKIVVDRCGLWIVVDRCGSFRVLVTTHDRQCVICRRGELIICEGSLYTLLDNPSAFYSFYTRGVSLFTIYETILPFVLDFRLHPLGRQFLEVPEK